MARAIWTGSIHFGLVTIPVKLFPAVREHALHFNYLHAADLGRIHYERVCSVCGKKVDWKDIVRGYEHERGQHVVLSDEDLKKAAPEATQAVDILEFVDEREIDSVYFDVPYYLEPERKGRHAYGLLRRALEESHKVGIARLVLRTREHLAALKPAQGALVVETMHWPDELVGPEDLELPGDEKSSAPEMRMASMLIDTMTAKFEPADLKDRYRDAVLALIEARAQGRPVRGAKAPARGATSVVDLMKILEKSIAANAANATNQKKGRKPTGAPPRTRRAGAGRGKRAA